MKIALYGLWHVHAPQYYRTAAEYGAVIGVYEENPDFRAAFCEKFPVPVFETPEDLLKSDADAVIVCSSSDTHADAYAQAHAHADPDAGADGNTDTYAGSNSVTGADSYTGTYSPASGSRPGSEPGSAARTARAGINLSLQFIKQEFILVWSDY